MKWHARVSKGLLIKMELAACSLAVYLELCESPIMASSHLDVHEGSLTHNNAKPFSGRSTCLPVPSSPLISDCFSETCFWGLSWAMVYPGFRSGLIFEVESQVETQKL